MESDIDENDKQSKKYDEENKSKFDYYFIICFTTILGYFLKSIINIILINYKDYSQFFYYAIGLYCLLIIISLFFIFCLIAHLKKKKVWKIQRSKIKI